MKTITFQNDILPLKNQLYRLALRITLDTAEAEDVVQETMIKVWRRRDDWQQLDSIEAFCLTICRNLALDKAKQLSNQVESLDESSHATPDHSYSANPEWQAEQRSKVEIVRKLIDGLSEKQRTVVQLRDFEGKSYKEISAIMDISEEQVKVNLFRARQSIKKQFIEAERYGL